ncbi:MAG: hypothetical protein ABI977_26720 [Acidobacteriota bacterium]
MAIALTPKDGAGMSMGESALVSADIIVSTTRAAVSFGIRAGSLSHVSHAMLYIGGGEVIEATGQGVVKRALATALHDATLAVAYRRKELSRLEADLVIRFAERQKGRKYDTAGAMLSGGGRANTLLCVTLLGGVGCVVAREGGFSNAEKFYCSELVAEAFRQAHKPIVDFRSDASSPQNIVQAYSNGLLEYVGHLIA